MSRVVTFLSTLAFAASVAGCTPPCERWCESTGDYIEFCLANGTADAWIAAKGGASGGWATWAATDQDSYVSACKSDMAAQVAAAGDNTEPLERTCGDEASQHAEWADHGICAELP